VEIGVIAKVSDSDLFEMCLRGEEEAWAYVYNLVLGICRWPRWNLRDSAEDLAQAIVLFLLEKGLKECREKPSFRAFVRKVAVNKILDSFKTPSRLWKRKWASATSPQADITDRLPSTDPLPEDVLMKKAAFEIVQRVFEKIPRMCREVLTEYFRYKMGFYESYNELSKVLHRPIGTISAQVRRCLDQFSSHKDIRSLI